jgi:hypothetical protein
MKTKRTQTTSRLHPGTKAYLDLIAAESELTFSDLLNSILTDYVQTVRERTDYYYDDVVGLDA